MFMAQVPRNTVLPLIIYIIYYYIIYIMNYELFI